MRFRRIPTKFVWLICASALAPLHTAAHAAQCGSTPAGFERWKGEIANEMRAKGVSARALSALAGASYASATIAADRNQHSFRLSLDQFLAKRGGSAIVARGRALKQSSAGMF